MSEPRLTVELVPSTSWFTNVRSEVSDAEWNVIRRSVYRRARHRCEVCGGRGPKWPVECHEVWSYEHPVQRLDRLVALCPACHEVKHIGLAQMRGRLTEALEHMMRVNDWTKEAAVEHWVEAVDLWEERSALDWTLDLDVIRSAEYRAWLERVAPAVARQHSM